MYFHCVLSFPINYFKMNLTENALEAKDTLLCLNNHTKPLLHNT